MLDGRAKVAFDRPTQRNQDHDENVSVPPVSLRGARTMMVLMVLTGLLAGLSSVGLLAVINKLINGAGATSQVFAVAFIGLAVLKVVSNYLSQLLLVKFAQETILNLGMELCWKVVRAPYRTLERRGAHEILATLTDDTNAMAWAVNGLPGLAINVAILAGCSVYLAWLSWQAFLGVIILAVLGLLGYRQLYNRVLPVVSRRARRKRRALRAFP